MSRLTADASAISGTAKGLVKGVALVDIVAASDRPLRQSDLIATSGLPHATAVRLLEVLRELDVLRLEGRGLYELGPRVAAWGQAFLDGLDITRVAFDLIEELVQRTDETCFLGVLDRNSVLYVAAVNSPQPVRPHARVGTRNPLHSTGIGKVLLAHASDEKRAALLTGELVARTPNTIIDRSGLADHLNEVRLRGFAFDDCENEEGVRCVAAPVRDHLGEVVAAVSVSAPAYRFTIDDLRDLGPVVAHTATELSRRLGFRPDSENRSGPESIAVTPTKGPER